MLVVSKILSIIGGEKRIAGKKNRRKISKIHLSLIHFVSKINNALLVIILQSRITDSTKASVL